MDLTSPFRDSTIKRTLESYQNPRLKDDAKEYFTPEHIEQLRTDSEIVLWDEYADPMAIPGVGILRRIGIRTAQGYTYDTLVGTPETSGCNVPVIGTSAWTTSLRGHNEHIVSNLMRDGNYVLFVGAEGSYITQEETPRRSPITLANSAAAVLNFSYHMTEELRRDGHDLDSVKRFYVGESRGGMVGEGVDALAEDFAQDIIFSDQIAPCLPEKLVSVKELALLGEQIIREPLEIYRLVGSLTLARLKYYPHTLDIRSDCVRNQIVIGGAIFSGETGAMSQHTPRTTLKHIGTFENDFASNQSWWERRYHDNPLVRVTPLPGGHLTIADLQTLFYVRGRNRVAQDFVNEGKTLSQEVFEQSHVVVERLNHDDAVRRRRLKSAA